MNDRAGGFGDREGMGGRRILVQGVAANNPISVQALGICSALAVTTRLSNSVVMGLAVILVSAGTGLSVSLLRRAMPARIRMIVEVAVIATLVIAVDLLLKAYWYSMSLQLGPYVGLIITNCIIMGRAEAFALRNRPLPAMLDGAANGLGYALVLTVIGSLRELLGAGTLGGVPVLSASWYTPNRLMVLAPGAFFALGGLIALMNWLQRPREAAP